MATLFMEQHFCTTLHKLQYSINNNSPKPKSWQFKDLFSAESKKQELKKLLTKVAKL